MRPEIIMNTEYTKLKSDAAIVKRGSNEGVGVHSDTFVTTRRRTPPRGHQTCGFIGESVIVSVIIAAFDLDLIRDTISQLFVFDLNVVTD